MNQLKVDIQAIIEDSGGEWGIAIEDLHTNEIFTEQADRPFYAASIIKIPIMITVFKRYEDGAFTLSDKLSLKREDMVGGSGVLQHMTPGTPLTIYDLLMLMIIQSDNTATNMLIDLVGTKEIQQTLDTIGAFNSKFYNKLMIVPVQKEGSNIITANDMTLLLKQLVNGQIISVHACQQMINIMKKQQIRESLPGKLPPSEKGRIGTPKKWELAHKTGNVTKVRHDVGIFYVGNRTLIASVLSQGMNDLVSKELFHDIGLAIFNYLNSDDQTMKRGCP
ncbi:serine hydrolase [Oceanobacillus halotolerans]|uniref:serine hydrolase n=1 Tax=Oceanobacillus halotolerans TaxID=2663380 RepID=UPI001CF79009|nr:serine hydrolase [Oceanobacillus halotolerans]